MMNIIDTIQHVDFGMPASARVRTASPCVRPLTGVAYSAAGQKSVLGSDAAAPTFATTDVAVVEGAFPGTASWSPPI